MCAFIGRLGERGKQKSIAVGGAEGIVSGKITALASLVKDRPISIQQAAEQLGMSVAKLKVAVKKLAL